MKVFVVAFLVFAAVSQGYAQAWPGFQGQSFQRPQVNFQELAQKYGQNLPAVQNWAQNLPTAQNWAQNLPAVQNWAQSVPAMQNLKETWSTLQNQLPQGNYEEWVEQAAPIWQEVTQQRLPQFGQSPFAQNLKSQIPDNYQQVLNSPTFKSWADKVMAIPNVQSMNMPA